MEFEERGQKLGKLVDDKQAQYGDAITASEQIMNILFPEGIPKEKVKLSLLLVRIVDKLCRLSRGNGKGDEDAFGDIAGYGLLGQRFMTQSNKLRKCSECSKYNDITGQCKSLKQCYAGSQWAPILHNKDGE